LMAEMGDYRFNDLREIHTHSIEVCRILFKFSTITRGSVTMPLAIYHGSYQPYFP